MMIRLIPGFTILALAMAPLVALAIQRIDSSAGSLAGEGSTPTHSFPVVATEFSISISEPDEEGSRDVEVRAPVSAIDTNNGLRNSHMWRTIFKGYERLGFPDVVFTARTDAPPQPGDVVLDGTLRILGVERPQVVDLSIVDGDGLRALGSADIDLSRWGIDPPGIGPMKVSNIVTMEFDLALPPQAAAD